MYLNADILYSLSPARFHVPLTIRFIAVSIFIIRMISIFVTRNFRAVVASSSLPVIKGPAKDVPPSPIAVWVGLLGQPSRPAQSERQQILFILRYDVFAQIEKRSIKINNKK